MLINFLHPRLKPIIECGTLTSEGYEIGNLISEDYESFQKGFLAERFVSGPIILTIKFICPVTLKSITIWPKVGSQRSAGFELSSLKSTNITGNDEDNYSKFATGVSRDDVDTVVFHKEGSYINIPQFGTSFRRTFFRGRNHENIISLRLKIFKSHFVAALKKIEIWGEPGYTCDWKTKKHVRRLWFQTLQRNEPEVSSFKDESVTLIECLPNLENVEIPEEFIDQITHEVMTLPVILPSGKMIDQRTLEKCQREEERWGRKPSDPFTGLVFTDTSKPVIDTHLKCKIDEFLLKHSNLEQIKYMPRRLGSDRESTFQSSSRTIQYTISKIIENPIPSKRKSDNDSSSSKKIRICEERSVFDNKASNNESNDLTKMLAKTLSNLPSFLSIPKSKSEERILCCIQCSVLEQLYKFPCEHILCRSCTIQKQNYCTSCDKSFNFAEIQKIHLNRNPNSVSLVKNV